MCTNRILQVNSGLDPDPNKVIQIQHHHPERYTDYDWSECCAHCVIWPISWLRTVVMENLSHQLNLRNYDYGVHNTILR